MFMRPSPIDPDALLTEVQAADLLCLSIRTLQAWRNQNRGPAFVRAGRAIRGRWLISSTAHQFSLGFVDDPARSWAPG